MLLFFYIAWLLCFYFYTASYSFHSTLPPSPLLLHYLILLYFFTTWLLYFYTTLPHTALHCVIIIYFYIAPDSSTSTLPPAPLLMPLHSPSSTLPHTPLHPHCPRLSDLQNTFFFTQPRIRPKSIYPRKTSELARKLPKNGPTYWIFTKKVLKWKKFPSSNPIITRNKTYLLTKTVLHFGYILPEKHKFYTTIGCTVTGFCTSAETPQLYNASYSSTSNLPLTSKGSADHAELCANTDANHTSTTFSQFFFLQISFILLLMKEYIFIFFRISNS